MQGANPGQIGNGVVGGAGEEGVGEGSENAPKVETYKIDAITTSIDDFENVLTKNYCVYTNYEDFSFAKTRSKDHLNDHFSKFIKANFSGDFQLQSWFDPLVLPKMTFLQARTKFLYTYKILHFNTECQLIQNTFPFPEGGRHIITPEGQMYFTGGYYGLIRHFSKNTFVLDDHRALLVPMNNMKKERSEHAMLYFKGKIYVFGGMNH